VDASAGGGMTSATLAETVAIPRRTPRERRYLLTLVSGAVLAFLCLPIVIVVPMSFSSAKSLQFPPPGLSLRWYDNLFSSERWIDAIVNSLVLACIASLAALILGTLAAYAIVRGTFFGRRLAESNFVAPMIIPPIITAVALFIFFAKLKLLGSFFGLVVAHAVLASPYVVLLMSVAIHSFDIRIEQVALTLGASKGQMLLRVLVPNLIPTALAAWIFAFIVSFDEVVITLFLGGHYFTIPKRMFIDLIQQVNPTITAIATILIAFSILTIGIVALLMRRAGILSSRRL
jgi:ABC-type spermidine/putrescine transport system permease subunit II